MSEFKIFFFGLICHVGQKPDRKKKRFAVLPKRPSHPHRFQLFLRDTGPVSLSANVTFSLPAGTARAERQFTDYVPSLDQILKGELKPEVADGTSPNCYYIAYPAGGRLDVADLYPCVARHFGNGQERRHDSVARLTYLSVDTTGVTQVVIRSGDVQRIVGPNDCILLAHSCISHGRRLPCGENPSHGDFREFEQLLTGNDAGEALETSGDGQDVPFPHGECTWVQDVMRGKEFIDVSTHIECGNTDYP
jgi:hypothetical protein